MKLFLYFFISSFLYSTQIYGQSGTIGDPYISLGQAWFAPSNGIYHFNIGGTTFSTYVESGNGWILTASGNSATSESSYSISTTLTLQSDAILPSAVYTSALITDVRMNSTSGPSTPFDVESSNVTVLSNLQNNRTLSVNTNNTDWTGSGTARLSRSCSSTNDLLSTHIYNACGNTNNIHWQVGQNTDHEKVDASNTTKNDLNLWVRAASVPLPIGLLNFNSTYHKSANNVVLDWQTSSEINNDYFTIEHSINQFDWEVIKNINGAGNSSELLNYSTIIEVPSQDISYYRLKQTDFDGQFKYSQVKSLYIKRQVNTQVEIAPNPFIERLSIEGNPDELENIIIYNMLGQNITPLTKQITINETKSEIDLSQLNSGIYYIKTKNSTNKVYKQ